MNPPAETRRCQQCRHVKPLTAGHFGRTAAGGFRRTCSSCVGAKISAANSRYRQQTATADDAASLPLSPIRPDMGGYLQRISLDDARLAIEALQTRAAAAVRAEQARTQRVACALQAIIRLLQTNDESIAAEPGWSRFLGELGALVQDAEQVLADLYPPKHDNATPGAAA